MLIAGGVYAQTPPPAGQGFLGAPRYGQDRSEANGQFKEERERIREERMASSSALRGERKEGREELKNKLEAFREERKKEQEALREEMKTKMEQIRERAKTEMEQKREEFKTKLEGIKDGRKKQNATQLSDQLDKLNARLAEEATQFSEHILDVLNRIEDRAKVAEANGKDISGVKTAIASAREAVAAAQAKITAQAAKDYTVTITTESSLGADFKKSRDAMKADYKAIHDALKAAREAARAAFEALKPVSTDDDAEPSTNSTQ